MRRCRCSLVRPNVAESLCCSPHVPLLPPSTRLFIVQLEITNMLSADPATERGGERRTATLAAHWTCGCAALGCAALALCSSSPLTVIACPHLHLCASFQPVAVPCSSPSVLTYSQVFDLLVRRQRHEWSGDSARQAFGALDQRQRGFLQLEDLQAAAAESASHNTMRIRKLEAAAAAADLH